MHLIRPSATIITPQDILYGMPAAIEAAARTCYKSEDKADPDRTGAFVKRLVCDLKHESVIEHCSISVRFIVDRGVSHELVRHRLASFSQESTRYVNYANRGIEFVIPPWVQLETETIQDETIYKTGDLGSEAWLKSMADSWVQYSYLLKIGWKPECARSVLPNSLKTEIVVTANLREWRHILKLRTSMAAHPQMRELMMPLYNKLVAELPEVFSQS